MCVILARNVELPEDGTTVPKHVAAKCICWYIILSNVVVDDDDVAQ